MEFALTASTSSRPYPPASLPAPEPAALSLSNRLAAMMAEGNLYYGWIVVGATFLAMLATAGAQGDGRVTAREEAMAKRMRRATGGISLLALSLGAPLSAHAGSSCAGDALSALGVPNLAITSAILVAADVRFPAHCDVKGSVATNGDGAGPNAAGFEIKLPDKWNGKLVFFGVGGLAGSLAPSANPRDFVSALGRGYATVITDTGHVGKNAFDPQWILEAPGKPNEAKIVDYFYRAAHQVTVAAKLLIAGYYSAPVTRAYFDGCSFGGHMGLMEAMRYPEDYDGVVAGAPYLDNHTQLWGYKNAKAFLNAYVPPHVVAKVNDAILSTCDEADGVKDGLIQNPAKCSFDPQSLVPAVLTQTQADAFKIFIRATTDARGHTIYPGSSVSDLTATDGPAGGFLGWVEPLKPPAHPGAAKPWGAAAPVLWAAAEGFTKYIDLHDPAFDFNHDWPERDGQIADDALRRFDDRMSDGDVGQPDRLASFLAKGRKLILYHGYDDTAISPFRTVWFYEDLAKGMGGYDKARENARLFMVPGMLHCQGGPGPNDFDTLGALEGWVEEGKAPESIVAAKYPDNKPGPAPSRTMPLCVFPEQARYKGTGDVSVAENWTCPEGDASQLEVGADGVAAGMGSGRK
jgi:feruloyl esterase